MVTPNSLLVTYASRVPVKDRDCLRRHLLILAPDMVGIDREGIALARDLCPALLRDPHVVRPKGY